MRNLRLIMVLLLSDFLIYTPLLHAGQLSLPTGDIIAPEVTHAPNSDKVISGDTTKISAQVTDNVGVKIVVLFYRTKGSNADYQRISMNRDMDSDVYSATINDIQGPGIEYYIQATDLAGNALLHGHSFSPLMLAVESTDSDTDAVFESAATENTSAMETSLTKASESSAMSGKTWLWIGLGVLAAGALASSGGGGDTKTSKPTTGTVVITGPAL